MQSNILNISVIIFIESERQKMSRVSFAEILKSKEISQSGRGLCKMKTLKEYMDYYMTYQDNYDYTIRFKAGQNLGGKLGDYQGGVNPLDSWISSKHQSKQSQQGWKRKAENQFMKLSPTNSQKQTQQKYNVTDIGRNNAQAKGMSNSSSRKFLSPSPQTQPHSKPSFAQAKRTKDAYGFQSQFFEQQKLSKKYEFSNQMENSRNMKEENQISEILKKNMSPVREKKKLSSIVEGIKSNLAHEIQIMAQDIVNDRKKADPEEIIMNSPSNVNLRLQNARKQIGQYLKIKELNQQEQSIQNESQTHFDSGVGYSFAHQFNKNNSKMNIREEENLPNIQQLVSENYSTQKYDLSRQDRVESNFFQRIQSKVADNQHEFPEQKRINIPLGQINLANFIQNSISQGDSKEIPEQYFHYQEDNCDKFHKLGEREIKVVQSRDNFSDIKSSIKNEESKISSHLKSPDTANKGVESHLQIQSKIAPSQFSSNKKPLPAIAESTDSGPQNHLKQYLKQQDSPYPSEQQQMYFKKIASPLKYQVNEESMDEIKPFYEGSILENSKREEEGKSKKLKITLSPKYQQILQKPDEIKNIDCLSTSPFPTQQNQTQKQEQIASLDRVIKQKQEVKENNQYVLNKIEKQEVKFGKGVIEGSVKVYRLRDIQIKAGDKNNKFGNDSNILVRQEQKKSEPLIHISKRGDKQTVLEI